MSKIPTVLQADHSPDRLVVGPSELVVSHPAVTGRARYARGTVVAADASGTMTICGKGQAPAGVLGADVDCINGDVAAAPVVVKGTLNSRALVLGDGQTADDVFEPLRSIGINLVTVVSPVGAVL